MSVVTRTMKNIAWGIVIFFNLFFLYYMMTMALTRARDFQVSFATACTIQLMFEIFIFETLEVAWVQYIIPHLVVSDVRKRIEYLRQQITDAFDVELSEIEHPFDATEYLFVSARLAKEFPTLFESEIILIFSNYLPGAIGERWKTAKSWRLFDTKGAGFTIFLPMLAILQWMGTFSMRAQKAIMHVFQPIICALGVIAAFFMAANPIWLIVPATFVAFEVYQWLKRKRKAKVALLSNNFDLDAKIEGPLRVKPEPEGIKITDIDDRPLKIKPKEEPSPISAAGGVNEELILAPSVEKCESTAEEPKSLPLQSFKKKKAFAAYEIQEEKEKCSIKNSSAEAVAAPGQLLCGDEDDDRTVYDDDGRPSGVKKHQSEHRGRLPCNTAARKKTRQDRLKARELFEQFEKCQREEEASGSQRDLAANLFENPPKVLDPFRVSPLQQSLAQVSSNAASDDIVPSPYVGKDVAPLGLRDIRAGRVHLPPLARQGGPGCSGGSIMPPNDFMCFESEEEDNTDIDDPDIIPKLKWEK